MATTITGSDIVTGNGFDSDVIQPNTGSAFSAYHTASSVNISTLTWTKVPFGAVEFDVNGDWDTTNYRFQPSVAGYYHINLMVWNASGTYTASLSKLYKNGSAHRMMTYNYLTTQGLDDWGTASSALVYMNGTTDYIEAYCYVVGGSTINYYAGGGTETTISGYLVREA